MICEEIWAMELAWVSSNPAPEKFQAIAFPASSSVRETSSAQLQGFGAGTFSMPRTEFPSYSQMVSAFDTPAEMSSKAATSRVFIEIFPQDANCGHPPGAGFACFWPLPKSWKPCLMNDLIQQSPSVP